MNILVLGGPNLNLLGSREPEVYGKESLQDIENFVNDELKALKFTAVWKQSNSEADLINWIQEASRDGRDAIIINPAAFTHTSVAIYDALKAFNGKKIEVHLSNTNAREDFRKTKITTGASDGVIEGFGKYSYLLAFKQLFEKY